MVKVTALPAEVSAVPHLTAARPAGVLMSAAKAREYLTTQHLSSIVQDALLTSMRAA